MGHRGPLLAPRPTLKSAEKSWVVFFRILLKAPKYVSTEEIPNLKKVFKSLFEPLLRARPRSKNLKELRKCSKK